MSLSSPPWVVVIALAALAGLVACTDDVIVGDGGPDSAADSSTDAGVPVTPPDIPWLATGAPPIMLAPCPDGWREVEGRVVPECDPYPEGGPEACDEGEAHFVGEPGCRPIGDACPPGDYATSLPDSGLVLYVKTGAPAGGDGSIEAPLAGLSEVPWVSLSASTTIALAKGTYPGTLPLKAGVTVTGACVAETVVTGIASPVPSVVVVTSAGEPAVVQNLTIRGAPQGGALAQPGRRLSLRGVLIDRVQGLGVHAFGAGAEVSLTDVMIRDTQTTGRGASSSGRGVHLQFAARLEATRLLVVGNRDIGVSLGGEGVAATLTDTGVQDTRARDSDGLDGRGISVLSGAHLDATRLQVSGNHRAGVAATGVNTMVTMTDAIVSNTQSSPRDGRGGRGLAVEDGAQLSATHIVLAGNREIAVYLHGEGTRAVLTDAVIRDTVPQANGMWGGRGLGVEGGARVDATRVLFSDNSEVSALVGAPGSIMALTDAVIQRTESNPATGRGGVAVSVQQGGHFEASRLLIADNRGAGVMALDEGTTINLSDTVLRDTRSRSADGHFGRGIQGQDGARIEGTRLAVDRSVEVGVAAFTGASVGLRDVSVRGVTIADCAPTSCPGSAYGYGVGAYAASLSLTRFEITDAAVCGAMASPMTGRTEATSLDLTAGLVAASEIGACVQVDGYDLGRLTNDVEYRDNAKNLDTTTLPVPEFAEPLAP